MPKSEKISEFDSSELSTWNTKILRGVKAHDLAGKAGEIAAVLEDHLVRGKLHFGQNLSIYTLADQFGASRQPVSAAVQYLATIGYLEITPQVGCQVVSPSKEDINDFIHLFARTEGVIAQFAANRHSEAEAEELRFVNQEINKNPFTSNLDRRRMADQISLFHDRLSSMARSPLLVDRISNLRRLFRFYLSQVKSVENDSLGVPSNLNILRTEVTEKVVVRDAAGADEMMKSYIMNEIDDWVRVV